MNYISKIIALGISVLFVASSLQAQTASVVKGCVPLEVNFSPPAGLTAFFWDFKDLSAGSQDASPSHIFATPGVYEVTLNEGAAGMQVGTVTVTVLPDIEVKIDISLVDPCNPRRYQFTNNSIVPPGINVIGYKWTFGDGSTSIVQNPTHTYVQTGPKSVSLEILTDISGCNNSELFENVITVSEDKVLSAFFTANPIATCDVPAKIFFTTGEAINGATYNWDFDDGSTSTSSALFLTHDFMQEGLYTIVLTVSKGDCITTFSREVSIGAPLADFGFNDTLCINAYTFLMNNTQAESFTWTFEQSVQVYTPLDTMSPEVVFTQPGYTTINMVGQIGNDAMCIVDTTFQVFIQDPDVDVIVDPEIACLNPLNVQITTTEPFATYRWFGEEGGMTYLATYIEPERDSFFINIVDTMVIDLVVTTAQGCKDTLNDYFLFQYPEAHFIPTVHHGCAPLSVVFEDKSLSAESIVSYTYLYGNGDAQVLNSSDPHSYTFTEPGEYLVSLIIENQAGCIDTSWAVLIEVGTQLDITYMLDKSEICIGEPVTLTATDIDPNIDAFNFWTDEGRSHHCANSSVLQHSFTTSTGTFDIEYTVDYNGCRTTVKDEDAITVNGPKADLWYMINCDDPLAVMFADSSQDVTSIQWTFEEVNISDLSELTYTFSESGDYTVYLEAFNDNTGCPSQIDSVVIHARQIEAKFDLPDNLCDNLNYELDAIASIDVDDDCSKGYTWYFTKNGRPRRVGEALIEHIFPVSGIDIVTLEVVDINGCTATAQDTIEVFSIQPNFVFDKEPICFPAEVTFTDQSVTDTTIVQWSWLEASSGIDNINQFSNQTNPTQTFDFFNKNLSNLPIFLAVKDALGCEDTIQFNIDVYRPLTDITADPNPICIRDSIVFVATDITNQGSSLSYIWDFANGESSTDSVKTVSYNTSGKYEVTLNLTEASTGCQNQQSIDVYVTEYPTAAFDASNEGTLLAEGAEVCDPANIEFNNLSSPNDNNPDGSPIQLSYVWTFTNITNEPPVSTAASLDKDPTITFPKGRHEATLIVMSDYGCLDTISSFYNVIGASGEVSYTDGVCKGDSITFNLVDTVDVDSWDWDFGFGQVFTDVAPITQVFLESSLVTLSLLSDGIACETVITFPINFADNVTDTIRETIDVIKGEYYELPINVANPQNLIWTVLVIKEMNSITMSGMDTIIIDTTYFDPAQLLDCIDCNRPAINTDTDICYIYMAQYLEPEECSEEIFIYLVNPKPFEIEIPNLFTPNGDNVNDFFNYVDLAQSPKGNAVEEVVEFRIYDRWGKMVYNNESMQGWDGNFEGELQPAEVYGYYIVLRLIGSVNDNGEVIPGREEVYKGDVTLIR